MWAVLLVLAIILIYFGHIKVTRVNDMAEMSATLREKASENYLVNGEPITCEGSANWPGLKYPGVNENYLTYDGKVQNENFCGGDVNCNAGCGPGKCFGCRSVWNVNGKKCAF
jgi:hypothetical protein